MTTFTTSREVRNALRVHPECKPQLRKPPLIDRIPVVRTLAAVAWGVRYAIACRKDGEK